MSESDLEKSGLQSFLSPSVLVLIVGIIGYLVAETPLTSNRPQTTPGMALPPPPSLPGMTAIHARLWDDPLGLACAHSRSEENSGWPRALEQLLPHIRVENDGLGKSWSFREIVEKIVDTLPDQEKLSQKKLAGKALCLPVLVSGEPYEDNAEQRRRTTYAVLSALTANGFELAYPDRLSYVNLTIHAVDRATGQKVDATLAIPVKLFQKSLRRVEAGDGFQASAAEQESPDIPEAVLACWINESQLGAHPLAAISQVLDQLFQKVKSSKHELKECLALHILGPSDSDVLLDMAEEDALPGTSHVTFSQYADPILYSGSATVSSQSVAEVRGASAAQSLDAFAGSEPAHCGLRVVRTIGTDKLLVRLIAKELWLRGAWPGKTDPLADLAGGGQACAEGKYIVLLTELDTLFGRAMPYAFRDAFPQIFEQRQKREMDVLQVFDYLRGVDGELPQRQTNEQQQDEQSASDRSTQLDTLRTSTHADILASGPSQLDYIRRLESYLVDFHAQKRYLGEQGIVAIGVAGSDVYDKLLLLRALRGRFPDACFFTTDCDAEFCLEREYPTTRNLIIASHFALQLHPTLQRGAPVFRDSYQTASYFQCLMALGDPWIPKELRYDPWNLAGEGKKSPGGVEPLAFEVARHGLYQVTIPADGSAGSGSVHPPGSREQNWLLGARRIALLALAAGSIFLISTMTVRQLRDAWKLCLAGALILVIVLGTALFDSWRPEGEPVTALSGISVWAPTVIRVIAVMLAAGLIYKTSVNLEGEAARHDALVLPAPEQSALHAELARQITIAERLRSSLRFASWPEETHNASALYREYRALSSRPLRVARSAALAIPYLIFGFALMHLEGIGGMISARGALARGFAIGALALAVILVVALTAYAYDAMELCRRFVKHVGSQKPDWSPDAPGVTKLISDRNPLDKDAARELLTIELIAKQTRVAGKLVAYPFWPVLLLIFSRHPSFDYFPLPLTLLVLWGLALSGSILFAIGLRMAASQARSDVLTRMNNSLSSVLASADESAGRRAAQLRQFISDIKREHQGAFQPLMQDPIITALATLLGGTGGLLLIEQLLPYK